MKIQLKKVTAISPDKNQPRTHIDKEKLEELAVSIKNEGVINPIEIDKNNVIVTGEMRWRASKLAGLKEVPTKEVFISKQARYIRQVQENLNTNTMSALDTGKAIKKVRNMTNPPTTYRKLEKVFGLSESALADLANLTNESKEIKDLLKNKRIDKSTIASIRAMTGPYAKAFKKKVLKEEIKRVGTRHIAGALKTIKNPEIVRNIMKADYTGMSSSQVIEKVEEIGKNEEVKIFESASQIRNEIAGLLDKLHNTMENYPLDKLPKVHQKALMSELTLHVATLNEYAGSNQLQAPTEIKRLK